MAGGAAGQLPYQRIETSEEMPKWKRELFGYTPNAPEYSPFKALSRQAGTMAKIAEGMTTRPSWSSMYEAYGVKPGTDLTPYIQATRTGQAVPQTPIPASPAAGDIPAFVAPSETAPKKEAAQGGLMSLRKFAKGQDTTPQDLTKAEAARLKHLNDRIGYGQTLSAKDQAQLDRYTTKQKTYQDYQAKQTADSNAPSAITQAQAMNVVTPFYDPSQAQGQYGGVTNPIYQQALDQLRAVSKTPEQYGQATGIMSDAASRLMAQSGFQAPQVTAANIARGDIRDVAAQQAQVERMQGGPNVRAVKTRAAQMAGPESWTTPGTAQQYMNPYAQAVINQNVDEANRNFMKNLSALRGQTAKSKAYGGSRQGLEESEALRNQGYLIADIQDKGLSEAYQQALQQFNVAQGQGLQAGQANLGAQMQANLANQQAGMTAQQLNQLYGQGGFQAQAANQAAQNQAYNNYVQQMLTAQGMNQGMDYNTASQNAQLQQQAAIQNQQAALTAQGLNLQALNQAGQMGQGIGALGTSMWGQQQNLPQLWGAAGQTVQNLAQQNATGIQQTAQNWLGGMANAYTPVVNMLNNAPGGTKVSNVSQAPR